MTLNNSMLITPLPPAQLAGKRFEHGSNLDGKIRPSRVSSQWKSTAIRRGEKNRLYPKTFDAVIALQARCSDHSDIENIWLPVMEVLKGEISDVNAVIDRLDDLIYPDSLEDLEALKKQIIISLEQDPRKALCDPDFLEANAYLRKIYARDARKRQEQLDIEIEETRREKEEKQKYRDAMAEAERDSTRNIARIYGLPVTAFDHLPPDKALITIRTIRKLHETTGEDIGKCAQLYWNEVRPGELGMEQEKKANPE